MSNLAGNPWIDYATHNMRMAAVANNNGDYSRSQMLSHEASTNATLALACEQRTANLIALMTAPDDIAIPGVDYGEAARQLSEGLGMRAEK